jgi:hypothetical protein
MSSMMNDEVTNDCASPSHHTAGLNWDEDIAEPRCCCVVAYSHFFPKQAKTTQEVECLLDEDELAIVNSELDDHNFPNHPTIMA